MNKLILASLVAAGPSVPGFSFDGGAPMTLPEPPSLVAMPAPSLIASALPAPSIERKAPAEFSQAPSWFDPSRLGFDAAVKAEGGGTVIMRYGWRSQFEMSVFAFPGGPSVSFKEHASTPLGHPKRSFEASLETRAARAEAARIIRAVQARAPVEARYRLALEAVLEFLDK